MLWHIEEVSDIVKIAIVEAARDVLVQVVLTMLAAAVYAYKIKERRSRGKASLLKVLIDKLKNRK